VNFLATLLFVASISAPWSPVEYGERHYWVFNHYLVVPRERWLYVYGDPDEMCSSIFGPWDDPDVRYLGCTSFGFDEDGLLAYIYLPTTPTRALRRHEERHASGWVHP
jgi:hypothetical protein